MIFSIQNTVFVGISENTIVVSNPGFDTNEIRDKRWDITFQHGRITTDHVLGDDFSFVVLIDN